MQPLHDKKPYAGGRGVGSRRQGNVAARVDGILPVFAVVLAPPLAAIAAVTGMQPGRGELGSWVRWPADFRLVFNACSRSLVDIPFCARWQSRQCLSCVLARYLRTTQSAGKEVNPVRDLKSNLVAGALFSRTVSPLSTLNGWL